MSTNGAIDWTLVQRLAARLGIEADAIYVWRARRHIPHKFRLQLIAMGGGAIVADDFFKMDKARKREAASGRNG